MFSDCRDELIRRVASVRSYLSMVEYAKNRHADSAILCKGMVFVLLYAVYEYTVTSSVKEFLSMVKNDQVRIKDIRFEALALIMESHFKSISDVKAGKKWLARARLLSEISSNDIVDDTIDSLFPSDGSHFRDAQVKTIWEVFGVDLPIFPNMSLSKRIDEIVDSRNAIAHGRKSAEEVGRSFSSDDLQKRISDIESVCLYIMETLERHYRDGGILRENLNAPVP
jgi:hypothetical protein